MKIKNGDSVVVIAGKEKGKEGVVIETRPSKNRIVVEGVNMIKKHIKPSQSNQEGGILEVEGSIHVSNVLIKEGKVTSRVGYKFNSTGKKIRILKKNNHELK
jgi:large subunit ribosomal protein L24